MPEENTLHLLVGLGNPGQRYRLTRHNIGFRCIDYLSQQHHIPVTRKRFSALVGEGSLAGQRVILAKPQTFMNDSGKAVHPLMHWYKIAPQHILVIYDDLDIPLGRLRLRADGSSGGHRGIQSIITETGSQDFDRLRIGIGRPVGDAVDHVLNGFSAAEEEIIARLFMQLDAIIACYLSEGIASAMNRYNSLNLAEQPQSPASAKPEEEQGTKQASGRRDNT